MDNFRIWIEETLNVSLPTNVYLGLFIFFVLINVGFLIWAVYYAFVRKAVDELDMITWPTISQTIYDSIFTIVFVIIVCLLMFGMDFGLDQVINAIINA